LLPALCSGERAGTVPRPSGSANRECVQMRKLVTLLLLGSALSACSGGGSGGGGGTVVTPTPTPGSGSTPTPTPSTPSPSPTSTEPATGSDFLSSVALLYSTPPNIAACQAGTLKQI